MERIRSLYSHLEGCRREGSKALSEHLSSSVEAGALKGSPRGHYKSQGSQESSYRLSPLAAPTQVTL